jgi:cysteine-rich repeat protein
VLFQFRSLAVAAAAAASIASLAGNAHARTCSVVVSLEESVTLASLTVRIGYQSGNFTDIHGGCTSVAPDALGTFGVNAAQSRLNLSFISLAGLEGPTELAHCQFEDADNNLTIDDFAVAVLEASDVPGEIVDSPEVSVSLPDCDSEDATTTTSVTSTTTSTEELSERSCDITFRLGGNATIGSLDWQVLYHNASGEFAGSAGLVECQTLPAGTLAIYNDKESENRILAALINPAGIATPATIARCRFVPEGNDDPVAGDFSVSVKKATNLLLQDIQPTPSMTISKIECSTGSSFCGDEDVTGEEECDDGNQDDGDGCSSDCLLEFPCGDANEDGKVLAGDSLLILMNAVSGNVVCPLFVCDTDGNKDVQATDALRALKAAVGQSVVLNCPLP